MKITTTKIFKNKKNLFALLLLTASVILGSVPAYSQIDYNYGSGSKGFSLGIGAGAAILQSNWGTNPASAAAIVKLDYNFSQYVSLGAEGQYGVLKGIDGQDSKAVLYFKQTTDTYTSFALNLKVGLGAISNFESRNGLEDALKSIYLGTGVGSITSSVVIYPHTDGLGKSDNTYGATIIASIKTDGSSTKKPATGSFIFVPVNFGTNISLPGIFGSKVVINPNYQYNYVLSTVFDGYQPNTDKNPDKTVAVNGNQAFSVISLSLKYKF